MDVVYEKEGAKERIIDCALALSGCEKDERTEKLYDLMLLSAMGICGREDVPELMEAPLAMMLGDILVNGTFRVVASVKRGDVAITYADGTGFDAKAVLSPFVKLRCI